MRVETLRLKDFRAHADTSLAFAPGINLITGRNGAGKTNLLEAAHYTCLSKSFLHSHDQYAVRAGAEFFEVEAAFQHEQRHKPVAKVAYVPGEGKRVLINGSPLDRLSDIVGRFPVVVMSPADYAITAEGPEERRRFMDNILSQSRPVYLDDLVKYRRAVKQRNALLTECRRGRHVTRALMESWDAELTLLGSRIIATRNTFVSEFRAYISTAYKQFDVIGEEPSVEYKTIDALPENATREDIGAVYRRALESAARREREQGRTLLGPHRDELLFRLNNFELRRYASQGQHRTFGIALKLAKFLYLRDRADTTPLLLLDDVFGNLDRRRRKVFIELLESDFAGQCFITTTEADNLADQLSFDDGRHQIVRVKNGSIQLPLAVK